MTEDRLITIAIHTYDKAVVLKNILEHEGIEVVFHNVNLSEPVVSSGVRVRIKEKDLPLALRIIENAEIFSVPSPEIIESPKTVLVPIDFSDYTNKTVLFAFNIAYEHKAEIVLLHTFINPALAKRVQLTDALSFDLSESQEVERIMMEQAKKTMDKLVSQIKDQIKKGIIPAVKFRYVILEGVPEDVIVEKSKHLNPMLIVMATRGTERKHTEMIGSVTAEVLDTCRYPAFTIPESVTLKKLEDINHAIFFCNLDQQDLVAFGSFHHLFANKKMNVTFVHISTKKDKDISVASSINNLVTYCRDHYPDLNIDLKVMSPDQLATEYANFAKTHSNNLVVIPNKKRNAFSRLFNPSLAHKFLLHADLPMMVIPV